MPADLESILKLEVPVIVQIATRRMAVEDILNLAPGAIIELPKLANEPLDIRVSNKQVGLGTAVKVGENFGVRITQIGDIIQRIEAMSIEPVGHDDGEGDGEGDGDDAADAPDPAADDATPDDA